MTRGKERGGKKSQERQMGEGAGGGGDEWMDEPAVASPTSNPP